MSARLLFLHRLSMALSILGCVLMIWDMISYDKGNISKRQFIKSLVNNTLCMFMYIVVRIENWYVFGFWFIAWIIQSIIFKEKKKKK